MIEKVLSVPRSLYISYRFCKNVSFWKLPILVRWNCKVKGGKGQVIVLNSGRFTMGFGNVGIYNKHFSPSILELNGIIIINGKVRLGHGSRVSVGENATLRMGHNVCNTAEAKIICFSDISIGNDVLIGWEAVLMDTDFHRVLNLENMKLSKLTGSIIINDNVWIGYNALILKGCVIGKGCIIASRSVVSKSFCGENDLIAGNPAVIKKHNVTLYRE